VKPQWGGRFFLSETTARLSAGLFLNSLEKSSVYFGPLLARPSLWERRLECFITLIEGYLEGNVMKIHMRPPLPAMPLAPPPKLLPTTFQLEMRTEELTKAAQQQKARLKKQYGARKTPRDLDKDSDLETDERDHRSNRNLDLLA
jgi:hypothetical protein